MLETPSRPRSMILRYHAAWNLRACWGFASEGPDQLQVSACRRQHRAVVNEGPDQTVATRQLEHDLAAVGQGKSGALAHEQAVAPLGMGFGAEREAEVAEQVRRRRVAGDEDLQITTAPPVPPCPAA